MRLIAVALFGLTLLAQKPNVGTGEKRPEVDYYDSMADYFRQSARAVEAIAQKGIPAEEIPAVLYIARHSSMSPNQVIDARKSGKSFDDIARQANVKFQGKDFVREANVVFLSEYHGQPKADIERLRDRGATFIDINQQYRRVGIKPRTEASRKQ